MIELLVATCIFLVISSIVASALKQITQSQATIWNRTQMHSGVRGATELLQQEVGQAGRFATPTVKVDLTNPPIVGLGPGTCDPGNPGVGAVTVKVSSVAGLYSSGGAQPASYTLITTMDGEFRETTPIWSINAALNPPTITA